MAEGVHLATGLAILAVLQAHAIYINAQARAVVAIACWTTSPERLHPLEQGAAQLSGAPQTLAWASTPAKSRETRRIILKIHNIPRKQHLLVQCWICPERRILHPVCWSRPALSRVPVECKYKDQSPYSPGEYFRYTFINCNDETLEMSLGACASVDLCSGSRPSSTPWRRISSKPQH